MTRTNLPATLLVAAIAGAAAGFLSNSLLSRGQLDTPVVAASDDQRLVRLEERNADLQRAISELREGQALLASGADRVAARADQHVAEAGDAKAAAAQVETPSAAAAPEGQITLESAMAQLLDPALNRADRSKIWEQINKAGLLDEVVKQMEDRADREPNNSDLRVDLGNAYLQELFAGNMMKRGYWGTKADEAFDAALKLNPEHWEARLTKAVALSNWPAFTGKPALAITEFETLIQQQNAGPKKPEHAQTYLYLGNMYQASGSTAKALEAWQQGAALFPDNAALQQQLAAAAGH